MGVKPKQLKDTLKKQAADTNGAHVFAFSFDTLV